MEASGFFGTRLHHEITRQQLSTATAAAKLGVSTEHVRKLVTGAARPSPRLLKRCCTEFRLNQAATRRLVEFDKMIRRCGPVTWTLSGRNPEMAPLYYVWDDLEPVQREAVVLVCHALARYDRRQKRFGRESPIC